MSNATKGGVAIPRTKSKQKAGKYNRNFVKASGKKPILNRRPIVPADLIATQLATGGMSETFRTVTRGGSASPADAAQAAKKTLLSHLDENVETIVRSFTIDRSFIGRPVIVSNASTRLVRSTYAKGYRFLNPALSAGLTTSGTLLASSAFLAGASGDTQDSANNPSSTGPLGVASYKTLKLFLDISAISGATVEITAQSKDPVSGNWADVQIVTAQTAVGTTYANLGTEGIDSSFAIKYTVTGGTATFSLGYLLKDGLAGSSTGLNQTIYIGPSPNVNATTGFPILEGQAETFFVAGDTEVWAIGNLSGGQTLKIFELQ